MNTLWERFVDEPMLLAKATQEHASPGNLETRVTYEVLVAGALAAKETLLRHARRVDSQTNKVFIGAPIVLL